MTSHHQLPTEAEELARAEADAKNKEDTAKLKREAAEVVCTVARAEEDLRCALLPSLNGPAKTLFFKTSMTFYKSILAI